MWEVFGVCGVYGIGCFAGQSKYSEVTLASANCNPCGPLAGRAVPRNTVKPGCVVSSSSCVGDVFRLADGSQILGGVVERVAVDVVDHFPFWDGAVVMSVDHAVEKGREGVNSQTPVSASHVAAATGKVPAVVNKFGVCELVVQDQSVADDGSLPIAPSGQWKMEYRGLGAILAGSHDVSLVRGCVAVRAGRLFTATVRPDVILSAWWTADYDNRQLRRVWRRCPADGGHPVR